MNYRFSTKYFNNRCSSKLNFSHYLNDVFAHSLFFLHIHLSSYLATCGVDRKLKIWDLRSTYDPLSEILLPMSASTINFSQKGLLALGAANTVQV
ncbi:unnamed protein product [Schistosoma mattheei]|uniref:Uncharacterized protein n=1 Tax=Schistosoma mattheei TaxID=31246 RepID=A0A183NN90_9TREM|nr:unnamed protein product [Schistosoma mattheei]